MGGLIVVGVDGSPSSIGALRWAAEQARLARSVLEVVTAWHFPVSFGWAVPVPAGFDPAEDAQAVLAKALADAEVVLRGDLELRQRVVEGPPALALLEASAQAELLVVGSRGHGAFAGMLLGSVSEHCAAHARCPVVIVHSRAAEAPPTTQL